MPSRDLRPPTLLYALGKIELLNCRLISIVGSRRSTPCENQMAEKLARDLADRSLVIVSGLARGVDRYAHKGALRSLVTGWEDAIEELPTPIRADLLPVEGASSERRALLVEKDLAPAGGTLHHLLGVDESRDVDDLVGLSGLTSSEAALFDRERKGVIGLAREAIPESPVVTGRDNCS